MNDERQESRPLVSESSSLSEKYASRGEQPKSGPPPRVLVVDDEKLIADTLVRILNLSGFAATLAYSGDAAVETLSHLCPDIVLTDVRMPGRNGVETGILLRERCPGIRVVLFSGRGGTGDWGDEVIRSHGFELWRKPIHPQELVRRLRQL
jgi:CheY-like chemotaxis protein